MDVKATIQNTVLVAAERICRQAGAFLDKGKMITKHCVDGVRFCLHVHCVRAEPVPLITVQHFRDLLPHKSTPTSLGFVVLWHRPIPSEISGSPILFWLSKFLASRAICESI